jgi:hypothetical protein
MDKFQLQALILGGEVFDAKTSLTLGPAHSVPCHEALGAGRSINGVPEESAAQPFNGM